MNNKKTVVKSSIKIEDLIRYGAKTGYVCYLEDANLSRRVSVENIGECGVCVNLEKLAGEAIISTQLRLSDEAAEALCVMLGKIVGEQKEASTTQKDSTND